MFGCGRPLRTGSMTMQSTREFCRLIVPVVVSVGLGGLGPSDALGQFKKVKPGARYVDQKYDFKVDEPPKWFVVEAENDELRGARLDAEIRRTWFQDHLTAIGVFVKKADRAYTAQELYLELLARVDGKPIGNAKVIKQELRVVGGMKSVWFYVKGRGVGLLMKEEGSVPTRQLWVGIPRQKQIISFVLSASEATYERAIPVFKKMLRSVEIGGKQTKAQASVPAVDPDAETPDGIDRTAQRELERADALRTAGKYAEALEVYDAIGVKYAARQTGRLANERARALREDPAVQEAIKRAETEKREAEAAEQGGKWLRVARQMAKAKNYDMARKYYQRIIDKYPNTKIGQIAEGELKKLPK